TVVPDRLFGDDQRQGDGVDPGACQGPLIFHWAPARSTCATLSAVATSTNSPTLLAVVVSWTNEITTFGSGTANSARAGTSSSSAMRSFSSSDGWPVPRTTAPIQTGDAPTLRANSSRVRSRAARAIDNGVGISPAPHFGSDGYGFPVQEKHWL